MNATVSQTANVALSTAGGYGILNWIFECIAAHHVVQPDQATMGFMVGLAAPVLHATRNAVVAWFTKKTGIVLPQPQEQSHA